jgi:predicted DNA-binding transcriptional regulator AlpA
VRRPISAALKEYLELVRSTLIPRMETGGLMRAPQAARFLGLSKSTLAKWRVAGSGPKFIRAGRAVLYSKEHLQEWLAANTRQSTSSGEPARRRSFRA